MRALIPLLTAIFVRAIDLQTPDRRGNGAARHQSVGGGAPYGIAARVLFR
jgi:hypothetical protein